MNLSCRKERPPFGNTACEDQSFLPSSRQGVAFLQQGGRPPPEQPPNTLRKTTKAPAASAPVTGEDFQVQCL